MKPSLEKCLSETHTCVAYNLRKSSRIVSKIYEKEMRGAPIRGPQFSLTIIVARQGRPDQIRIPSSRGRTSPSRFGSLLETSPSKGARSTRRRALGPDAFRSLGRRRSRNESRMNAGGGRRRLFELGEPRPQRAEVVRNAKLPRPGAIGSVH